MTISDIYAQYPVTPNLARHMLRVGAVTHLIIGHWTGPLLQEETMMKIALLHDMGNILKFDFEGNPRLLEEEQDNVEKWKDLRTEWASRFANEDEMTYAIAAECGLSGEELGMMKDLGYGFMETIAQEKGYERKIVKYADMRAAPFGILPLSERIAEGHERYLNHPTHPMKEDKDGRREKLEKASLEVERQITSHCTMAPEEINDISIAPIMETLRSYEI